MSLVARASLGKDLPTEDEGQTHKDIVPEKSPEPSNPVCLALWACNTLPCLAYAGICLLPHLFSSINVGCCPPHTVLG